MDSTEEKFRHLLGVPPGHALKLIRVRRKAVREDLDFEEHDAQGNLVARHHWWDSPLRNESGWRKTAPDGTLLKERKYSMNDLIPVPASPLLSIPSAQLVPATIAEAGERASWRYVEFFTANISNPHTRRAYARGCGRFFTWCESRGLALTAIRAFDVAAYLESLRDEVAAPSVKQCLAALRMLFDWFVSAR